MKRTAALLLGLALLVFSSSAHAGLPDTGQTKCYNDTVEIACPPPGADFYGQDAQYVKPRSYTDLGNGIIRDNVSGLMWQKATAPGIYTWQQALDYVANLNSSGGFGGYSDWRLPEIKELSTLIDSSIPHPGPTINRDFFPDTIALDYWSSITKADNADFQWLGDFKGGGVFYPGLHLSIYIRLVRGGLSNNNFIDNGDDTVTDTSTGLMWQQATAPGTYTWQQALSYCENLELAGYNDWRLPDRNELQSLADYSRYSLAINTTYFVDTVASRYWSSTTYAIFANTAWYVEFYYGGVNAYLKSSNYSVRAVRSGQTRSLGDLVIAQTPMSGPPGTAFTQWGTGGKPYGKVTLHIKKPDATEYPPQICYLDNIGYFWRPYLTSVDDPIGVYTWWVVDDITGQKSNELSYEITAGKFSASVEVIDPQATTDQNFLSLFYSLRNSDLMLYNAMSSGGRILAEPKIAADGVTKLLVRVNVAGEGWASFSLGEFHKGTLSPVNKWNDKYIVFNAPAVKTFNGWKVYAVFTPPSDFTTNAYDYSTENTVNLSISFTQQVSGSVTDLPKTPINIVRPPVVLVHGIWSSIKDSFQKDGFISRLRDKFGNGLIIGAIDYKNSDGTYTGNARRFSYNGPIITAGVDNIIKKMRTLGIAVTQVDYVGHSMGGDLGRLASQDGANFTNYDAGCFHKFITIDTPHKGSWESTLISIIDETFGNNKDFGLSQWEYRQFMKLLLGPIDLGAVEDLNSGSSVINGLKAVNVPSHAIVGDYIFVCDWYNFLPFLKLAGMLGWVGDAEIPSNFDLVVSVDSQKGGISSSAQSVFDHAHSKIGPLVFSWSESTTVTDKVAELLNSEAGSSTFSDFPAVSTQTPSGSGALKITAQRSMSPVRKLFAAPASPTDPYIEIAHPMQGQTFASGDSVQVNIIGHNTTLQKVLIVGKDNMREVITEPFTDNITIPVDFIGDYEIGALGIDSANNVLIADNLILNIEPPATLEAISANPDTVFIDVGDNAQLLVDGLFGDTITRDITAAARGTTYSSDNESIATVSANGKITGLAVGSANIRIANSGDNATVPVTVSQPQAALMCLIATDNITVLTDTDQLPLSAFITSGKDVDQSVQYWFMLSRPDGLTVLVNPVAPLTLAAHESWADNVTLTLPLTGAGWHTLTLLATNDNGSEAQATFDFVIEAPPITTTTIPATTTTTAASTTTAPVTTTIPVTSTVSITTTSVIFSTTTTVAGGSTTTTPATTTAASTTTAPATTTTADTSTTTPVTTTVPASTTSVISSTTTAPPGSTTTVPATSTTVPNSTTTTVEPGTTTTSVATATSTVIVSTSTTMPVTSTTTSTVSAGPCPAKKVLGENNPKLENLRNFRDGKLAHSAVGRRMIQVYYNHAGSINAALERSPALRAVTRRLLEIIAPMM